MTVEEKHELRRMFDESLSRINAIRVKEHKAIADKRYHMATELAFLRIHEQKRSDQILGQLTGAL